MRPTQTKRWFGVADKKTLYQTAVKRILAAAVDAINVRGQFVIVLAGGSTPRGVYKLLCHAPADWSHWQVFFSDEHCLPVNNCGRNSRMASEAWLRHVAIPIQQIHVIPAELGAHQGAVAYGRMLRQVGDFDLVLLGLGDDGHVAGLFPAASCLSTSSKPDVVAVFDAPTPPASRVTLSAARLSRSRAVLCLVAGAAKRHAVIQWQVSANLPVCTIRSAVGIDVLIEASLLHCSKHGASERMTTQVLAS